MNPLRRAFLKPYHFLKGLLAAAFYGYPARHLTVIGVTGTDGKTTTAHLVYEILKRAGKKVALVSTVTALTDGEEIDTGFHVTSPDPFSLQSFVRKIVARGVTHLVLEVTSHGLDQFRVWGINFKVAVITNITHEHLDYHQTFADYRCTKAKILKGAAYPVLNYDDSSFEFLRRRLAEGSRLVVFSKNPIPEYEKSYLNIFARSTRRTDSGLDFTVGFDGQSFDLKSPLSGDYNLENVLAAVGAAKALAIEDPVIALAISSFPGVSGRLEEIDEGQSFRVVVDFAHTPNALQSALALCSNSKSQISKLIVVFGCAGLRDKSKRSLMGEIAGRLANISILTAEDPRTESVDDIINNIAEGCLGVGSVESILPAPESVRHPLVIDSEAQTRGAGGADQSKPNHVFVRVPDRRRAIGLALRIAAPGDVVLVTGKGHEKSMCFGKTEYPWSDQAVVREELRDLLN